MVNGRAAALDGMRGFAALVVVPYHALLPLHPSGLALLRTPFWRIEDTDDRWFKFWISLFNGECAVILFFILSGLVLVLSIERDLAAGSLPVAAVSFALRRALRIMPALAVCVLAIAATMWVLSLLYPGTVTPFRGKDVLDNLLLLNFALNGASWTLQAEMLAIPFLIFSGWMAKRFGIAGLWVCLLMAFLVTRTTWISAALFTFGSAILYFALGCLIPYTVDSFRRIVLMPWWMTFVVFLTIRQILPNSLGLYVQAAFGAFLVAQIYLEAPRLLTTPVGQFLGRISYSLYLWNVLFLAVLYSSPLFVAAATGRPALAGLVASVAIVALTVPVAMLSERFLERPGIRLGKSLAEAMHQSSEPRGTT